MVSNLARRVELFLVIEVGQRYREYGLFQSDLIRLISAVCGHNIGKVYGDLGSLSQIAFNFDLAAVKVNHGFYDIQPQPCADNAGYVGSTKVFIKKTGNFIGFNPNTIVRKYNYIVVIISDYVDIYNSVFAGIFYRIPNYIAEHLQ